MGQAKMRGTFEQRQEEGIAQRKAREADRKRRIKAARSKPNLLVLAMLAGLGIVGRGE